MKPHPSDLADVHFKRHRYPAEIIACAVWLYFRFPLSFRHVEELLVSISIEHCPLICTEP